MKQIFQSEIHELRGDCQRAAVASILEVELCQVPHFILYAGDEWYRMFLGYMELMGYGFISTATAEHVREAITINGAILASVKSKTYSGGSHAILINNNGVCIHDPNPNQSFLHENVIDSGSLLTISIFKPIEKRQVYAYKI